LIALCYQNGTIQKKNYVNQSELFEEKEHSREDSAALLNLAHFCWLLTAELGGYGLHMALRL
jgi:hypothetical protein